MDIPGSVTVTGFIAPSDTLDIYATHDALYGADGYRSVGSASERNAIPVGRRRDGMLVFVQDTRQTWRLSPDLVSWESVSVDDPKGYEGAASLRAKTSHEHLAMTYLFWAESQGDGAAGWFKYLSTSFAADDGVDVYKPDNVGLSDSGRWHRVS